MVREIKYRGRTKKGEWIEGYYCPACFGMFPCRPAIVPEPNSRGKWEPIEVDPSTVGQFVGSCDKNGKLIYEGDIIKSCLNNVGVAAYGEYDDEDEGFTACGWHWKRSDGYALGLSEGWIGHEVIGNIHDNPELLTPENS